MDIFLESHNQPKLSQKTDNPNQPTRSEETELVA